MHGRHGLRSNFRLLLRNLVKRVVCLVVNQFFAVRRENFSEIKIVNVALYKAVDFEFDLKPILST